MRRGVILASQHRLLIVANTVAPAAVAERPRTRVTRCRTTGASSVHVAVHSSVPARPAVVMVTLNTVTGAPTAAAAATPRVCSSVITSF